MNKKLLCLMLSSTLILLNGCSRSKTAEPEQVEENVAISEIADIAEEPKTEIAIVATDTDLFSQPVPDSELELYYNKSNKLGYELFTANTDETKIVSPVSLTNALLNLDQISDGKFMEGLKEVADIDDGDTSSSAFSESYLQNFVTDNSVWVTNRMVPFDDTRNISSDLVPNFELFLSKNTNNKNELINGYAKEKLSIEDDLIPNQDDYNCVVTQLNDLSATINLKSTNLTYKNDLNQEDDTLVQKQYINAENVIAKYVDKGDYSVIELPLKGKDGKESGAVIDIFCKDNDSVLKNVDYDSFIRLLRGLDNTSETTIKTLNFVMPDYTYNFNQKDFYESANLGFMYEKFRPDIFNGLAGKIQIDQLNQVNKIELNAEQEIADTLPTESVDEVNIDGIFDFVIRDTVNNNMILYIGVIK